MPSFVRKLVEDWFMERGLKLREELSSEELVFLEGNNTIYVRIPNRDLLSEEAILEELSHVMRNRLRYNKAYLVLPAESRGLVNGKLFRGQWTGAILYDTRSEPQVVELIPSVPITTQIGDVPSDSLRRSIEEIRNKLESIRIPDLSEINARLRRLEDKINELERRVMRLESSKVESTHVEVRSTGLDIEDNPWVEMLRRKGGGG